MQWTNETSRNGIIDMEVNGIDDNQSYQVMGTYEIDVLGKWLKYVFTYCLIAKVKNE